MQLLFFFFFYDQLDHILSNLLKGYSRNVVLHLHKVGDLQETDFFSKNGQNQRSRGQDILTVSPKVKPLKPWYLHFP